MGARVLAFAVVAGIGPATATIFEGGGWFVVDAFVEFMPPCLSAMCCANRLKSGKARPQPRQ